MGLDGRIILKYNFMKLEATKWSYLAQHIHSYLLVQYIRELNTYAHKVHIYWDICGRKNTCILFG